MRKGILCARYDGNLRTYEPVTLDYDLGSCDHAGSCIVTKCGYNVTIKSDSKKIKEEFVRPLSANPISADMPHPFGFKIKDHPKPIKSDTFRTEVEK